MICIIGTLGCWVCSFHNLSISFGFAGCYVIYFIGFIITSASLTPILPDLVGQSQRGVAGAIWGICGLLGAGIGYIELYIISNRHKVWSDWSIVSNKGLSNWLSSHGI